MAPKRAKKQTDSADQGMSEELRAELENIRRLMIVLLVKLGSDSKEIGLALGVDSSTIRKMLPLSKISRLSNSAPAKP